MAPSNPSLIDKFITVNWKVIFFFIVFINLVFRLLRINESLYGDEAFSVFYAQQPLSDLYAVLLHDRNPPLYFSILHYWIRIFGLNGAALKSLSVLFSTGTAVFILLFGSKFLNKFAAVVASVLYLLSMVWLVEGLELRAFALEGLLAVMSFYFYLDTLKFNKKSAAIGLAIVNVLLLLTHYLAVYIPLVQLICSIFFFRENRKGFIYYLISQFAALVIYLPWVKIVIDNVPEAGVFWLGKPVFQDLKYTVFTLSGNGFLFLLHVVLISCFIVLILLNKIFRSISEKFNLKLFILLLGWYIIPVGVGFLIAQYTPIFRLKYVVYTSLGLFLLIGYIIGSLRLHYSVILAILAILLFTPFKLFNLNQPVDEDWKSLAWEVKQELDENTGVVICASYKSRDFTYYYNRDYFKKHEQTNELLLKENILTMNDPLPLSGHNFDDADKLIYIRSHDQVVDPEGLVKAKILERFTLCSHQMFGNINVERYIKKQIPCSLYESLKSQEGRNCGYWQKSVNVDPVVKDSIISYHNSFEYHEYCSIPGNADSSFKYSGNYSLVVSDQSEYGALLTIPAKLLISVHQVEALFYMKYEFYNESRIVFSVFKDNMDLYREERMLGKKIPASTDWKPVEIGFDVPEIVDAESEIRIYFWNPSAPRVNIDDVMVKLIPSGESE